MIQMQLTGLRQLDVQPQQSLLAPTDKSQALVEVLACAICRTDAKMWEQGHRDLVFPRVLGHEMIVRAEDGRRYIVWPGSSCGTCSYCLAGKENLCDDMKIAGFHHDGGFAHQALVPSSGLIPVPDQLDNHVACFAEPVGCVINAFDKLPIAAGKKLLIYGGGTMGLIAALYARQLGLEPLILEKDEAKIRKIKPILVEENLVCCKETLQSLFDLVINTCPDYIAFCQAISKVDKGGHISFFSGISKNETLETNLVNLIHYKEATVSGAYGMKQSDMERAVPFLISHAASLTRLIEAVVSPEQAPALMPEVLSGKRLKYILDFTPTINTEDKRREKIQADQVTEQKDEYLPRQSILPEGSLCRRVVESVFSLDKHLSAEAEAKMDDKAKPLGSLGRLEPLAISICRIQRTLQPRLQRKGMLVFAADHGVVEEGVSAYPAEVTGQMVDNYLNGGAAINVICRRYAIDMKIVDMGVKKDFSAHSDLIRAKVAAGTRNMALQTAMTHDQAVQALESGIQAFFSLNDTEDGPLQILGLGEMGIGNTTSAAAIISVITGITPGQATGRGTGIDDEGLKHKTEVIEKVLAFHQLDGCNGLEILIAIGGFELAGIAGAALAAASQGCAVVLDGVISTAAGLIAYLFNPAIRDYLIAGHKSVEQAQSAALAYMGLDPVVDLAMRLGEGTGAALTIDLAATACQLMSEMASFDEAKISRSGTKKPAD